MKIEIREATNDQVRDLIASIPANLIHEGDMITEYLPYGGANVYFFKTILCRQTGYAITPDT